MNPTNSQTNLPLPSLTQVTSRWPIIPISPKLPDGAAIISDRAHIYSLSPEYSSSESDSSNTVENPVVQSAKEKLVSFSIQQEAAIWDAMLALCASKSNAGRRAGNYIPFQGIAPYNLEGNATEAWVITGLRSSKQTGSIALSKGSTIYIGDYSKADDKKFPEVASTFIILGNAIWQEPGCIIYGGLPVLNSRNICPPLPNPPPVLIAIPKIFTHHSDHFAPYMKGSIGQRINVETRETLLPLREWERKPGDLKGEFIYSDAEKAPYIALCAEYM